MEIIRENSNVSKRTKKKNELGIDCLAIAYEFLSIEDSISIHNEIENPETLSVILQGVFKRDNVMTFKPLQISVVEPSVASNVNKMRREKAGSTSRTSIDLVNTIKQLTPETDLWDSAMLDYFVNVVYWADKEWQTISEQQHQSRTGKKERLILVKNLEDVIESDILTAARISLGFCTAYIMLWHLQLYQKASGDLLQTSDYEHSETAGLVRAINFLKSLFSKKPVIKSAQNSTGSENCVDELFTFENRFVGLLSQVHPDAAVVLVGYLTDNFFRIYRLLEQMFGPITAKKQNIIGIPCKLKLNVPPMKLMSTGFAWPIPLSDAVELNIVSKYSTLFDERVTRWLQRLPQQKDLHELEPNGTEQTRDMDELSASMESVKLQSVESGPEVNQFDKYLKELDGFSPSELEALTRLSTVKIEQIVANITDGIPESTFKRNDETHEKLTKMQLELAHYLISEAKSRMNGTTADMIQQD